MSSVRLSTKLSAQSGISVTFLNTLYQDITFPRRGCTVHHGFCKGVMAVKADHGDIGEGPSGED